MNGYDYDNIYINCVTKPEIICKEKASQFNRQVAKSKK